MFIELHKSCYVKIRSFLEQALLIHVIVILLPSYIAYDTHRLFCARDDKLGLRGQIICSTLLVITVQGQHKPYSCSIFLVPDQTSKMSSGRGFVVKVEVIIMLYSGLEMGFCALVDSWKRIQI